MKTLLTMIDGYQCPLGLLFPRLLRLTALFLVLSRGPLLAQTTRYVSTTGTNANPATATSWATSTSNLQGAIDASAPGDQVWVAGGTYKPTSTTDRTISFAMKDGVALYGGFAGTETNLNQRPPISATSPSSAILSGEIGSPSTTTDNSLHVISNPPGLTITAILDGFVILAGNTTNGGSGVDRYGGGMLNNGSGSGQVCSPLIRACTFVANVAFRGGAIYNNGLAGGSSRPVLTNCSFQGNRADDYGGAIFNGSNGNGISSPLLTNCSFQGNTATEGGAIYNGGDNNGTSSPLLTNCSFQGNIAGVGGGAIYNSGTFGGTSIPVLTNCSFQGNRAIQGGGGAIYNDGGGSSSGLTNCVLWNNGATKTFFNNNATVTARYSLLDASVTGYTSLTGTIATTTSPYASTTSTQLAPTSLAINTGDPATTTATVGATDLAGNPRFAQGRIDRGAFEWGNTCQGLVTSLKDGSWDDLSVWSCNVLPSSSDIVQLNHVVSLSASYVAHLKTLRTSSGKVTYQSGATLKLGL